MQLYSTYQHRRELSLGEKAISHGLAIASVVPSKDLGNMPPNIANPAYLALPVA